MADALTELSGEAAKRYRILETLGTGGMGEVFLGQHIELGRNVAIKRLKEELALDKSVVKRFVNEARAVNLIRHENIVEVTDFFSDDKGRVHMVMELLEGRSLGALIRSMAPLPFERVAHIGVQIAEALAAAHKSGVIHRDLKPENVFLIRRKSTHDYVKLLDFGIARLHPKCGGLEATESGIVMGTPVYMPPEQAKGTEVSAAADTYSLGVILYEMLSGRGPFPKTSAVEMMMAHISEEPRELLSEGLPQEFRDLVARCLAKDPSDRPKDMSEVVQVLEPMAVATKESEPMGKALGNDDIAGAETWDHSDIVVAAANGASASFSQIPVSPPKSHRTRNVAIVGATVLSLAIVMFLVVRGRSAESGSELEEEGGSALVASESIRSKLDKEMVSMGFSPTPPACKSSAESVVNAQLKVAILLGGGKPGRSRPQDLVALKELRELAEDIGPETSLWKARTHLLLGETAAALRFANQAAVACPQMATAYALAGTALALSGKHSDAIEMLEQALSVDGDYIDARFNLALSQLAMKQTDSAIENLSKVLTLDSGFASARYLRGHSYLQQGKAKESLADLEIALGLEPDNAAAWYLMGFAHQKTGDSFQAKEAFCKAAGLGHKKAPCDKKSNSIPTTDPEGWQADPFDPY